MALRSLICLVGALSVSSLLAATPPTFVTRVKKDVETLASDAMEGRGLGTKGLARAAEYIEQRLRESGVRPAFGRSYRQRFQLKTGVRMTAGNVLRDVADGEWLPLAFSSSGRFEGDLVFVGYGIHAPEIGYDDFAGVDLRGKVALMLRYEPQESDDASPFSGSRPSRWSSMRYKVHEAKKRGAVAVVFATGPLHDAGGDRLPPLRNDGPQSDAGLPVVQVRRSVAQRWLGEHVDLKAFQQHVDRTLAPRSRAITAVRVSGRVAVEPQLWSVENVVGVIPGKGSLARDAVVIGAHYDHLGFGGTGSMRPNDNAVHNGADDNASGTAAVITAAESLRESLARERNHRTVYIALFAGEEVGLAGSAHFVASPPVDIERVVAMVNLDMVGRLRNDELLALGADTAAEWRPMIAKLAVESKLNVKAEGDGYGRSDQASFYAAGVPVVHLFSGLHDAYHTPDDDVSAINIEGLAKVAHFTAELGEELAVGRVVPRYVRATAAPPLQGDGRGYGAYLGSVPDVSAMSGATGGVLLSDVRAGSPAELAGLRKGDRLVALDGSKIDNLYDLTFALQSHRPGETVTIGVLREGEKKELRATLTERGQPTQPRPAAPAPAAQPHSAAPPTEKKSDFYENRPGSAFVIGAGRPFTTTFEGETHFSDIRQLTFGGENAEAYFSPDGKMLIFQATGRDGAQCDRQYTLDLATGEIRQVSSGKGRTTCGYFDYPEQDRIVYASTEAGGEACPPPPDRSHGYVWPIYDTFDLWESGVDGSNARRLTTNPGYDAEATWCHRGGKLVFTSTRDGDLDLYEMNEGGEVRRLTDAIGYDGGAFYSPDCREIVWRASRPEGVKLDIYKSLLAKGMVAPSAMELFVMDADGTNQRQITKNGAANFCPYFTPDGKKLIYSSNAGSKNGREFDLWMIDKNGGEAERITYAEGFDGFPMFSPDGLYIVWASNRANPEGRETNLFIAKWR